MKPITAGDPESKSPELVAENIERLRELFPEAFTEGKVNFDVLKQLLGGAVDEREEKYGLNWHGKRRARQLALTPSTGTLRPSPEESVDWDSTQHLLIEGDNLEVLKLLTKSYSGSFKLIYIDPPYNTGGDFVYPDDFDDNIKNYLMRTGQIESDGRKNSSNTEASGRFHTDWLNMVYPRLKDAIRLIRHDGVILVSIDDKELSHLKQVMTELLGEENFIGTIVWKGATDNNPTQIAIEHEYLVCFARSKEAVSPVWKNATDAAKQTLLAEYRRLSETLGPDLPEIQARLRMFIRANRESLNGITHYDRVDERGVFTGSRKVHNPKPGGYKYDVLHPRTQKACVLPVNGYRYPRETMDDLLKADRILFGDDETQIIQIKEYLEDYEGKLSSVISIDSRAGSNELNELFGEQKVFQTPKPTALLTEIFEFMLGKDEAVLDFFAGSGSTAHAVMLLNERDGGTRRSVLVQFPEPLDPENKDQKVAAAYCDKLRKPRNIAELTKERLRRAAKAVREKSPLFAGDLGFRVFKLASSNIKAWEPDRDNLTQTVEGSSDHLLPDRTEQDILFELLLKLGLDLCVPIEQKAIAGKTVHNIGAGTLFVCLAPKTGRDEVEALALGIVEWHKALAPAGETTVVFRDSAFADDVAKTNLAAILQQHGLENVRSL